MHAGACTLGFIQTQDGGEFNHLFRHSHGRILWKSSYSLQLGIVFPAKEPVVRKGIRGLLLAAVILSLFSTAKQVAHNLS